MEIKQIPTRLEVYFWLIVIRLISQSKFVQACLREVYALKSMQPGLVVTLTLVWSGAGLILGIVLGLLGI